MMRGILSMLLAPLRAGLCRFDGGDSSTTQTTNQYDQRTVLGEGSSYANNGASIRTSNYVLDNGAVNKALQVTGDTASNLGGAAIYSARDIAGASLNFGSDALGTVDNALSKVDASVSKAFSFGSDALAGALDSARNSLNAALDAASGATSAAISSNNGMLTKALNFGSDALGIADSYYTRALDYSTRSTDQALSNLQATQQLTAAAYNDAKGRGALTDKMIMLAIGVMGLVAFMAVNKGKL